MNMENSASGASIPIACKLPDDQRHERGEDLADNLFSSCDRVEELADGYAFRFPGVAPWPERLCQFVLEERNCCSFFRFELIFLPGEGSVWLRLTGAEGVKEFIAQNFPLAVA